MSNFNLQYPIWFLFLVILTGLGFAYLLYRKDKSFLDKTKWLKVGLFVLRSISISLIAFFLLEPFFKNIDEIEKKPLLIIAQDASTSILQNSKNDSLIGIYPDLIALSQNLSEVYDVRELSFGSDINFGLTDTLEQKATNINKLFDFIGGQYYGNPIAGVVLASDGIFNQGQNPVYHKNISNTAIYPIAIGDTVQRKDLSIKNVYYNKIAFLGDQISISFDLASYGYNGQRNRVQFFEINNGSKTLIESLDLSIDRQDYFTNSSFIAQTKGSGTMHLRIEAGAMKGELSYANNSRDIFIEILDSKVEVKVIANSPHPDLTTLKKVLESNQNYKVEITTINKFKGLVEADVVILHNLPSMDYPASSLIDYLNNKKIPHFFIVGQQSNINLLDKKQDILKVNSTINSANEVQASLNSEFSNFELDDAIKNEILQFPPLLAPFGNYTSEEGSEVLFYQKIGNIETKYPLLSFSDRNGIRKGILMGEGIWKWYLNNFAKRGNHKALSQLIMKSIQYLSIKEDKRRWQIELDKKIWNQNERIKFSAYYYNESFEAINEQEARMTLFHESGNKYEMVFSRKGNYYVLDAGYLPTGKYNYDAVIETSGGPQSFKSYLIVKDIQIENVNLQARHDILNQMAQASGGKLYYPDQINALNNDLKSKEVRSIIYSNENYVNLINVKWLLFLIIIILGTEWFLRRYHGSY